MNKEQQELIKKIEKLGKILRVLLILTIITSMSLGVFIVIVEESVPTSIQLMDKITISLFALLFYLSDRFDSKRRKEELKRLEEENQNE